MQLNLGTKKNFSEANMRRIISILTGLMSSVSSLEDQCIKEYNDTVTYQKGQIVIGSDGYFYEAKTVATGTWDSSKWTKIGTDDITELDVDTIKGFLGLTQDQLDTLAKIISDDTIELSKTWSSSKIYTDIQDTLKEAKQYCITELAKKSTGSFKKANDTTEVTDGNYLYLILNPSTSKYDIYALVDSNVELLTSVDVNLDDYYTKTETDSDFLKKTDAASTYATITTVDGKMDKKTIATIIGNDNVETHDQLVSAKAAAELKRRVFSRPAGESILDYADSIDTSTDNLSVTVRSMNCPDAPYGTTTGSISNDCYYTISKIYNTNDYCTIEAKDIRTNRKYIRMKTAGTWYDWVGVLEQGTTVNMCNLSNGGHTAISSWIDSASGNMIMSLDIVDADDKVCRIQFDYVTGTFYSFKFDGTNWISTGHYCVTKVDNVPPTDIAPLCTYPSALTVETNSSKYTVKNGFCTVNIVLKITSCTSTFPWTVITNGLPKASYLGNNTIYPEAGGTMPLCVQVTNTGELKFRVAGAISTPTWFTGSFTYPVAD